MYAFGDGLLLVAVISAVSLVPSGLALWYLQSYRWFSIGLSVTAVGVAGTAIVSAFLDAAASHLFFPDDSPWAVAAALAVVRMLLSAPLAATFLLAAVFAADRASRWLLMAAAAGEAAVAGYAVVHWSIGCYWP